MSEPMTLPEALRHLSQLRDVNAQLRRDLEVADSAIQRSRELLTQADKALAGIRRLHDRSGMGPPTR